MAMRRLSIRDEEWPEDGQKTPDGARGARLSSRLIKDMGVNKAMLKIRVIDLSKK